MTALLVLAVVLLVVALALFAIGRAVGRVPNERPLPAVRPNVSRCPRCGGQLVITPATGRLIGRADCAGCDLRLEMAAT